MGFAPRKAARSHECGIESIMATNNPYGDDSRTGAVRKRSQLKTPVMGEKRWTERSKDSGRFLDQSKTEPKFKGVRRERGARQVRFQR
jgi:hypothetical protein